VSRLTSPGLRLSIGMFPDRFSSKVQAFLALPYSFKNLFRTRILVFAAYSKCPLPLFTIRILLDLQLASRSQPCRVSWAMVFTLDRRVPCSLYAFYRFFSPSPLNFAYPQRPPSFRDCPPPAHALSRIS